jgi:CheY-like chemotaxis protein
MIGFFSDISNQRNAQEALEQTQATLETRVKQRTSELAEAYAIIRDQAIEQETIANLGRQALRGGTLSSLIKESSDAVRKVLHADYCSVLQIQPNQDELIATGQSGWPDPDICLEVPLGNRSQSGFTLEIRCPVIVTDMATETRFSPSQSVITHGVTSSASVIIGSDDRAFGVLAVFSKDQRNFNVQAIHFLQSIANVLAEAIRREHDDVFIRYAHKKSMVANRTKAEFLSSMSHELRTPLNVIFGFTQLLQLDRPTPSQVESIEHIAKAGKHLLTLIDELLEIAGPKIHDVDIHSGPIAQTVDSAALPNVTILYIEDQPLNQRLVERILQPYTQYHLISSTLGSDGIESAKKNRPDLILLDLNLPDMRGDEVLHQLKANPTTRNIPVVMVSADAMQGRSDQLRRQGASAYISKPYKVTELLDTIKETIILGSHPID